MTDDGCGHFPGVKMFSQLFFLTGDVNQGMMLTGPLLSFGLKDINLFPRAVKDKDPVLAVIFG